MIIEALKALLIGIVEGITEWLPISSTGHMILVDEFVKLQVSPDFLELFLAVSYTHLDVYKRQVLSYALCVVNEYIVEYLDLWESSLELDV